MKTSSTRRLGRKLALAALVFGMVGADALRLDADQIFRRRAGAYTREDAEKVTRRLYMALLNREADPNGFSGTVAKVQAGQLEARVNEILQSEEFRTRIAPQSSEQMMEQIYRGLLDRSPNAGEARTRSTLLARRQYASVVLDLINSPEFQRKLDGGATGGAAPAATPSADLSTTLSCQERVVEQMRNDLPGLVFLRFDDANSEGSTVRGAAGDVLDNNRRVQYRCEGGQVSYNYEDGRRERSGPNEGDFPNDAVRACQNAVRGRVSGERGGVEVTFESAGLMPSGSRQQVRGLGFEKKQGGANFHYTCELQGNQVVSSSHRWR